MMGSLQPLHRHSCPTCTLPSALCPPFSLLTSHSDICSLPCMLPAPLNIVLALSSGWSAQKVLFERRWEWVTISQSTVKMEFWEWPLLGHFSLMWQRPLSCCPYLPSLGEVGALCVWRVCARLGELTRCSAILGVTKVGKRKLEWVCVCPWGGCKLLLLLIWLLLWSRSSYCPVFSLLCTIGLGLVQSWPKPWNVNACPPPPTAFLASLEWGKALSKGALCHGPAVGAGHHGLGYQGCQIESGNHWVWRASLTDP